MKLKKKTATWYAFDKTFMYEYVQHSADVVSTEFYRYSFWFCIFVFFCRTPRLPKHFDSHVSVYLPALPIEIGGHEETSPGGKRLHNYWNFPLPTYPGRSARNTPDTIKSRRFERHRVSRNEKSKRVPIAADAVSYTHLTLPTIYSV